MKQKTKKRPVYMYALHGPFLREFASVQEASRAMEISATAIYNNLAGRSFSCARKFDFYYERQEWPW